MSNLIVPFFIPHSGCPHTCLFCNQRVISGVKQPYPTADQISETVLEWVGRSARSSVEVAFYGGSFTLLSQSLQKYLLDSVQPLIASNIVESVRISTRPDALDDNTLKFLAANNVKTVEIGVQSLDDEVLRLSERGHTAADSLKAIKRVREAGFLVGAQLLPGLPGDTSAKSIYGIKSVIQAGAQMIRIYPAVVLEGTVLAEQFRSGNYQPLALDEGVKTCAIMLHLSLKAGIPVIRIGLQADDGLSADGAIIAGCWHPAFGELVKAQLFYDLVFKLFSELDDKNMIKLFCNPDRISQVEGHKRSNIIKWREFGLVIPNVLTDSSLDKEEIRLESLNQKIKSSVVTSYLYEEYNDA